MMIHNSTKKSVEPWLEMVTVTILSTSVTNKSMLQKEHPASLLFNSSQGFDSTKTC